LVDSFDIIQNTLAAMAPEMILFGQFRRFVIQTVTNKKIAFRSVVPASMGAADVKAPKRKATKVAMEKMDIVLIIRQLKMNVQVYQSVFGVGG
jgi:hypothetical protein